MSRLQTASDVARRSASAPTQTVTRLARAEVVKLLAPGGVRGWLVASFALGLIAGLGTVLLSNVAEAQAILQLSVAGSLSSGPLVVLLTMTIATASYVPREVQDGTVVTAKCLVPRTGALFLGRLLGWWLVITALAAGCAVVTLVLAVTSPDVVRSGVATTLVSLVLASVVPPTTIALVHLGAIILRRGAFVVAVGLAVLLIIPLVAALGQVVLTGVLAAVAERLASVMVGPMVLAAMSSPGEGGVSWASTVEGLLGLAAWLGVTAVLALRAFARPGYGEN